MSTIGDGEEVRKCISCDGRGTYNGCPVCGKRITLVSIAPEVNLTQEQLNDIPEQYRTPWDSQILRNKFSKLENEVGFDKYIKSLDSLVERIQRGSLPSRSSIILSSVGLGKTKLAYHCMALAKAHNMTVGPLLDNTEYRRLNNLSAEPQLYKEYLRNNKHLRDISLVTYSDLQFMTIDPCNFKDSYLDIMSLISKRDRLGKSTIILSSFTINQITYTDYGNMFARMISDDNVSSNKTLRRVEYFVGGM